VLASKEDIVEKCQDLILFCSVYYATDGLGVLPVQRIPIVSQFNRPKTSEMSTREAILNFQITDASQMKIEESQMVMSGTRVGRLSRHYHIQLFASVMHSVRVSGLE